jgi:hypothetical protein
MHGSCAWRCASMVSRALRRRRARTQRRSRGGRPRSTRRRAAACSNDSPAAGGRPSRQRIPLTGPMRCRPRCAVPVTPVAAGPPACGRRCDMPIPASRPGYLGIVNAGTAAGSSKRPIASATRTDATPRVPSLRDGGCFSTRDQGRYHDHPCQARHPEREQRGHQRPAAAETPRSGSDPHSQRSGTTVVAAFFSGTSRSAAPGQAGALGWRELIRRAGQKHSGGQVAACPFPGEQAAVMSVTGPEQRIAEQAGRTPDREVPAGEELRSSRRRSAAFDGCWPPSGTSGPSPRSTGHHRRHHHDPHAEVKTEVGGVGPGPRAHSSHAQVGQHPGRRSDRQQHAGDGEFRARWQTMPLGCSYRRPSPYRDASGPSVEESLSWPLSVAMDIHRGSGPWFGRSYVAPP